MNESNTSKNVLELWCESLLRLNAFIRCIRVDKFFIIASAPNTISHNGIIFCIGQLFKYIIPSEIIVIGIAMSTISITIIVIEQQKYVPILFNNR